MLNCKDRTKAKIPSEKDQTHSQGNSIFVHGITDDKRAFEYFTLLNTKSYYLPKTEPYIEKFSDSIKIEIKSINESQIIELMAFGDKLNYNTRFLVSPKDSIFFKIENKKIVFIGNKSAEYNFYTLLDSSNNEFARNKFKGNLINYKKSCDSIYERRISFFNDYVANNSVSSNFKKLVKQELKYEYLYNLIAPRIGKTNSNLNFNVSQGVYTILSQKGYVEKNGIFNFSNYINNITLNDFKDEKLINSDYFKRFAYEYVISFSRSDNLPYTLKAFNANKKYVEQELEEPLKNYIMVKLLLDYYDHGFGSNDNEIKLMKKTINEYYGKITSVELKTKLDKLLLKINIPENTKMLKKIHEQQLITINGHVVTLDSILKENKQKIKVIDIWASWCKPCIEEIIKTKNLRDNLTVNNDIQWLYLSIDKDESACKEKVKIIESYTGPLNQFIVPNNENELFTKNLKIEFIPRYIIFNKQDKIVLFNAPKPSDSTNFKTIINTIK